jgi:hypothetical protein
VVTNVDIAELMAREAEQAKQPLQRALRRASRRAFLWPVEVEDMVRKGEDLTQLAGIGPYLNKLLLRWLRKAPETMAALRVTLAATYLQTAIARFETIATYMTLLEDAERIVSDTPWPFEVPSEPKASCNGQSWATWD